MKRECSTIQICLLREEKTCQNHRAKASPRKIVVLFDCYKGGLYCTKSIKGQLLISQIKRKGFQQGTMHISFTKEEQKSHRSLSEKFNGGSTMLQIAEAI